MDEVARAAVQVSSTEPSVISKLDSAWDAMVGHWDDVGQLDGGQFGDTFLKNDDVNDVKNDDVKIDEGDEDGNGDGDRDGDEITTRATRTI